MMEQLELRLVLTVLWASRRQAKRDRAVQGKSMQSDGCKAQRHEAGRGKAATDVGEQAPVAKKGLVIIDSCCV